MKTYFTYQNVSSYNLKLTMGFLNSPIKTLINQNLTDSDQSKFLFRCDVCTTLRHTTVFTYSHANTPLGQSEHAYYLSYFINSYITCMLPYLVVCTRLLLMCTPLVLLCTRMLLVCYSYVLVYLLVCYPYLTRIYATPV